jgi:dolichyldiphosphatase
MEQGKRVQEFELTWVVYDPADPLGALLALFTLSPIFLVVVYLTVVASQRDLDSIAMLVGQVRGHGL